MGAIDKTDGIDGFGRHAGEGLTRGRKAAHAAASFNAFHRPSIMRSVTRLLGAKCVVHVGHGVFRRWALGIGLLAKLARQSKGRRMKLESHSLLFEEGLSRRRQRVWVIGIDVTNVGVSRSARQLLFGVVVRFSHEK